MGLASLFLGDQNPFSQWTTQNSNLLGSIGAGVASGTNLGQGLANAAQYVPQGRQLDVTAKAKLDADAKTAQLATQAEALKSKYADFFNQNGQPDYARAVADGLVEPGAAYLDWMKGKQGGGAAPQNPYMSAGDGKFFNWQTGEYTSDPNASADASGGAETGFTPIWGTNDGKPAIALPGKDGRLYIDGQPIDPSKFVPTNPYDLNAQKGAGSAFGKATGGAQFTVPNAQLELDQSNAAISNLKTDPKVLKGMDDWFQQWGALPRGVWVQGGSDMAQFRNSANNVIDRSWLSARAALKGGGQITDYEGAKAENAVSMMKSALDSGDKGQFEKARDDYEYWVQQGFTKLQQQAGGVPGYGASGGSGGPAVGAVEDGHRFKGGDPSVQANWEAVQ